MSTLPRTHRARRLERALVALAAVLATLLLAGSTLTAGSVAAADDDALTTAASETVVRTAPVVRRVVSAAGAARAPSLVQAQLREQRTAQLQAQFTAMLTDYPPDSVTDDVDPRISAQQCRLLGRTWTSAGCSRQGCVVGHEYAKTGANAETCRIGGRRGASYGVEVDFRRCDALHRAWIGLLNYCASDPHRDEVVVPDAEQCRAPYTSYVLMSETEGSYDECLRPERVGELQDIAAVQGRTLADVAAERSETQCGWRPAARLRRRRVQARRGRARRPRQRGRRR